VETAWRRKRNRFYAGRQGADPRSRGEKRKGRKKPHGLGIKKWGKMKSILVKGATNTLKIVEKERTHKSGEKDFSPRADED